MKLKKYRPNYFEGFEDEYFNVNSKEELLDSDLCKVWIRSGYEISMSVDYDNIGYIMAIKPTDDEDGALWWVVSIVYNKSYIALLDSWLPKFGELRKKYIKQE